MTDNVQTINMQDNRTVVGLLRAGDEKCFDALFRRYYKPLCTYATRFVAAARAEELVQDTLMWVWENRTSLLPEMPLKSLLFTIIKNKCLNHLRHKTIALETINNMQEEYNMTLRMNLDSLEAFEQHIFSDQDIEDLINRALDSLPTKCKEIFIMNKLEGKKQEQIATELNLSTNTVRNQISIAYKKLRNELKDYLPLWLFLFHCT